MPCVEPPNLVELWRTALCLHTGSAVALSEVLTAKNLRDLHGRASHLTKKEAEDLLAYLLSL